MASEAVQPLSPHEKQGREAQLCEFAGISGEPARLLLEVTRWSVEDALALHFAGLGDGAEDAEGIGALPASASLACEEIDVAPAAGGEGDAAAAQLAPARESVGWFGSISSAISGVSQAVLGVASEDFEDWFASRYGAPTPSFSTEPYGDSVTSALAQGRLLLIWFHQDESVATQKLCTEVFQSTYVTPLLAESYTVWAGDVCRFEPWQIARLLSVATFPTVVACQPLQHGYDAGDVCLEWPLGHFARPLFRLSPASAGEALDSDQVIAALASAAADHRGVAEERSSAATARSLHLAEERRLREEQDREYEEALLMDQVAAVSRLEGTDEEAAAAALRAEAAAEAAQATEEEQRRLARGAEILSMAEPVAAGNSTVKLSVRLPSGDRLQRAFPSEARLSEVYEWAHSCRPVATPASFVLCTSFPARKLEDKAATLAELDLAPSCALAMQAAAE